jgi:hypothetical protein
MPQQLLNVAETGVEALGCRTLQLLGDDSDAQGYTLVETVPFFLVRLDALQSSRLALAWCLSWE